MITEKVLKENIGNYIRLDGLGNIQMLKQRKTRCNFSKIIEVDSEKVALRKLDVRGVDTDTFLLRCYWIQDFEIITKEEFETLPLF